MPEGEALQIPAELKSKNLEVRYHLET